MKKKKIIALLLTTIAWGSFVTSCASKRTEETLSESFNDDAINETYENESNTEPTSTDIEYLYHIGDYQILANITTGTSTNIDYDSGIPSDFDTRYDDLPMMIELAHEYAQLGTFYDYYTTAMMNEYTSDGLSINGEFYCYLHGFRVDVNDSIYDEERYYVTLAPEELALEMLSVYLADDEAPIETDYGYTIPRIKNNEFCPNDIYMFNYDYYTDSHLLVLHYGSHGGIG